jgi:hypothetical protein
MANEMRDRLVEHIENAKKLYEGDVTDLTESEYVAECLLTDGVIVTPCKVGDTIYCIDYILEIVEKCRVYGFYVINEKIQLCVDNGECKFVTTDWHYNKSQAEQKLKEMRGE